MNKDKIHTPYNYGKIGVNSIRDATSAYGKLMRDTYSIGHAPTNLAPTCNVTLTSTGNSLDHLMPTTASTYYSAVDLTR